MLKKRNETKQKLLMAVCWLLNKTLEHSFNNTWNIGYAIIPFIQGVKISNQIRIFKLK